MTRRHLLPSLGAAGQEAFARESASVNEGLAAAMRESVPVDDPRTQALVARHFAQVAVFWTPDAAAYAALGRMYTEDPRFTTTYDAVAPGLATYLRDAMAVHASQTLR